ncbi:MAG TPA: M14 family metallopeptidase [Acidobacteriota bacterium]|nr:M14 family metallopeptidase [Acidobacteriota bacterium]
MILRRTLTLVVIFFACVVLGPAADLTFDRYHKPEETVAALQDLARANPGFAKVHMLAKSPGGRDLALLEIGPETGKTVKTLPAVFVAANMEGTVPLSTEAALFLAKALVGKSDVRSDRTWWILACGNPDAAALYFAKPQRRDARNARPMNDDQDDAIDEDGPDDLDGDGLITQMRVKDPEGSFIAVPGEARLMKKADGSKGEKGIWKLYPEGIDNDGDGEINEDGPGGINLGTAFPHLYKYHAPDAGPWPGSEPETYALFKFFGAHREIGLAFTFGASNWCLAPPRAGRKGDADYTQIKIPERVAGFINADPTRTYTMAEIIEMVKPLVPPGMEVTEGLVAGFLELGAVVNPLEDDLKFYKELSEKYKEFLKAAKLDGKRLEPDQEKDASFELWAYYHLGLPSFALDFWTLPEVKEEKPAEEITPDKLEKMTNDEFIALGEEKIDAFLKTSGAPDQFKAKQVIEALKGGQMSTKKMAEMMRQMPKKPDEAGADPKEKALLAWSDKELGGKGFVPWKPFKHPTLGDVEIGGAAPFAATTPPAAMLEGLLKGQVPWVFEAAKGMARIKFQDAKVKALGGGVYEVKAWVENAGGLPYPTAMASRNERVLPVIVSLAGPGVDILEGKKRSLVKTVPAHGTQLVRWLVRAMKPVKLEIKAETEIAWSDSRTLDLGGVK